MGNIGSHVDLTSECAGHQAEELERLARTAIHGGYYQGSYTRTVQRSHEVRNGRFGLRLKYTF